MTFKTPGDVFDEAFSKGLAAKLSECSRLDRVGASIDYLNRDPIPGLSRLPRFASGPPDKMLQRPTIDSTFPGEG